MVVVHVLLDVGELDHIVFTTGELEGNIAIDEVVHDVITMEMEKTALQGSSWMFWDFWGWCASSSAGRSHHQRGEEGVHGEHRCHHQGEGCKIVRGQGVILHV